MARTLWSGGLEIPLDDPKYWIGRSSVDLSDDEDSGPEPDPAYLSGWGGLPIWRDEFDYRDGAGNPAVDPAKWWVWSRGGSNGLGLLNDASVVDPSCITVDSSGICHVKAEWLDTPVTTSTGPAGNPTQRWHKTGYMTHNRPNGTGLPPIFAQRYGRWEIRARVPTITGRSMGTLAAFWARNTNSGEWDIMEAWGSGPAGAGPTATYPVQPKPSPATSTTTIHTETSSSGNVKVATTLEPAGGIAAPNGLGFHVWAAEWTPTYIRTYVDGVLCAQWLQSNPAHAYLFSHASFQTPWHLRINLHIGPSTGFWGLPDPLHRTWSDDLDFQIDYVRIWPYLGTYGSGPYGSGTYGS